MERRIYFSHHMYGKKMAFTQEVFYTNEVVPLCQRERFVEEVTKRHLLKLFSYNSSEAYAREIQAVLTKYFQNRLDVKSDELRDNGILD